MVFGFSCEIKRPSSTKDRNETVKFWKRFFDLFSNMWKIRAIYKADKMEEKTKLCSIPTSALKKDEMKLFHIYYVFLSTK